MKGDCKLRVSVIIPVINEAAHIEACLRSVLDQPGDVEILVVDGGSTDATASVAARHATVLTSGRGRAVQMNFGARRATGDVLLFLHGDSVLHVDALKALRRVLADPAVGGGTFTLRFDAEHPVLRFYAWCTGLSPAWFRYGDQGIFLRSAVFEQLTGFRELPILEDVDLLRRLRQIGRLALVPRPITTSARRFLARGIVRQQLLNATILAAHAAGVAPERLARWYDAGRS